jgi:hypothetical protein
LLLSCPRRPVWRADGKELYYATLDDKLVAVPVRAGARFEVGLPQTLFGARPRVQIGVRGLAQYDVTPDGQRFVLNRMLPEESAGPMTVVVNWAAGLRQ